VKIEDENRKYFLNQIGPKVVHVAHISGEVSVEIVLTQFFRVIPQIGLLRFIFTKLLPQRYKMSSVSFLWRTKAGA